MKYWKEKENNLLENKRFWQGSAITKLAENEIFVFGSNPEARHFAGAAKSALKFGAIPRSNKTNGIARGLSPNKQTYGIITKNLTAGITVDGILYEKEGYLSVSTEQISANIDELYLCAKEHSDRRFLITYKYESWPNGSPKKSLNGYTSQEMLEMFAKDKEVPPNIIFHESYKPHLEKLYKNQNKQINSELVIFEDDKTIDIKEEDIIWTIDSDERNPQGINGAGAAKAAMSLSKGAKHGIGRGFNGLNAYALVTKSLKAGFLEKSTGILYEKEGYLSVSAEQIKANIDELYQCAKENPEKSFIISYQYETWPNESPKKSLNGYTSKEILEMFVKDKTVPDNIVFHESYKPHIENLLGKKEVVSSIPVKENKKGLPNELKNIYPAVFDVLGIKFVSVEHFMAYSKAKNAGDKESERISLIINEEPFIQKFINGEISAQDISSNKDYYNEWMSITNTIKSLSEEIKTDEASWKITMVNLMPIALKEKMVANPEMKAILKDYVKSLSESDLNNSKFNQICKDVSKDIVVRKLKKS